MKKIFAFLMFATAVCVANAQRIEGSFDVLKNEARVNFQLNYSKASIHGMTEAEFAEYEEDWHKDMPQIVDDFLSGLNSQISYMVSFGKYPSSRYTLRVDVSYVEVDGSCYSNVLLLDSDSNVVAKIVGLQASGGMYGTKLYLIKKGAERSGRKIGRIIYQRISE